MRYPATLIKKPNGSYSVTFPDLPEAEHAAGADISDALNEGRRAFLKALPLYVLVTASKRRTPALQHHAEHGRFISSLHMIIKNKPEPVAVASKYLPGASQ